MERRFAQFRVSAGLLQNEDGVAIVAVMLILVLITIIGIASTNVSNTEVTIAGNQAVYQQNFYMAEGATIEAIDNLEQTADPLGSPPSWLENDIDAIGADDIVDATFWSSGKSGTVPEDSNLANTRFVAVSHGIVAGSSLGISSSKVHRYDVYGRCASAKGGITVVNIGYLMAF